MKTKYLFAVLLLTFVIRLIGLNQSLWLDEATTARVVSQYGLFELVTKFSPTDFHPPLYYIFMKIWTNIFGYSAVALRIPSILFSLFAGWIIYKICRLRESFGGPIWATVFFLFNPLIIYYSQEARMYMMTVFLLVGALYHFVKIINGKSQNPFFFALFIALAFYTFYGSIFLIAPMLFYFIYKKQYRIFVLTSLVFIVPVLALFPLTVRQFVNSKIALVQVANWASVLGKASLKNLVMIPVKFVFGRIDFFPKWIYYGLAGGWTAFVFLGTKAFLKKENGLWVFLFVSPLVLGLVFSIFSPLLQYFRFLYLIPILSILLSLKGNASARWQPARLTGLAGGFVILSLVYLLLPRFHREDWKSLANSMEKTDTVYMVFSSSDPLRYYNKKIIIKDLSELNMTEKKEIKVIPYVSEIHGSDYKTVLEGRGYSIEKTDSYRGLKAETWVMKANGTP